MDTAQAIRHGQLVNLCYSEAFTSDPHRVDASALGFDVIDVIWGTVFANRVPFGLLCRDVPRGTLVAALRGTMGIDEWEEDFRARLCPWSIIPGTKVEEGFRAIWDSLQTSNGLKAATTFGRGAAVAGHSLGAALATLLAVEAEADELWSFAGPRVGDDHFVAAAMPRVHHIYRFVNTRDFVPRVPIPIHDPFDWFDYHDFGPPIELTPGPEVCNDPGCNHHLDTYLHLLDPSLPVSDGCLAPISSST